MNKKQFAHTIRAAAGVLGVKEVLVIGSQAVHASLEDLFPAADRSIETDIAVLNDKDGRMAALCLELHDLWISKALAGRDKDKEFCEQLVKRKLVKVQTLIERLKKVTGQPPEKIGVARGWIELFS